MRSPGLAPRRRSSWVAPSSRPVVIIDCENGLRTVSNRLQLVGHPAVDYYMARSADLGSRDGLRALGNISSTVRPVIILDSLIGLHRIDEDKAAEVRQFVSGIRQVGEETGATVIGLTHDNRGGNMRGSLDWRNAVDTVLELRKDGAGWRTLKVADRRNGAEGDSVMFRFGGGPNGELELITTAGPNPGQVPSPSWRRSWSS
ncbi:MAG: AAA family ATPase [Thermoleophilia bacterium]